MSLAIAYFYANPDARSTGTPSSTKATEEEVQTRQLPGQRQPKYEQALAAEKDALKIAIL